ncbi:MAG: cell shape determination protein CcmA [Epsilonproteobacteria bacterium]|jgi:cytoskeletal protein CcmA (bactofilin family)|nr:cell shape determination protein CcmA [Campylobacterota bacterium]NPA89578.1 cell shape determination protein CcmA [Campylobacterota bacterium]
MAIFGGNDSANVPLADKTTVIAKGTRVAGEIEVRNEKLYIDGEVEGEITAMGLVVIGRDGKVSSKLLRTDKLSISGYFEGNIDCNFVEILAGGRVVGKIMAREIIIEPKGLFEGETKIKREETTFEEPLSEIPKKEE